MIKLFVVINLFLLLFGISLSICKRYASYLFYLPVCQNVLTYNASLNFDVKTSNATGYFNTLILKKKTVNNQF